MQDYLQPPRQTLPAPKPLDAESLFPLLLFLRFCFSPKRVEEDVRNLRVAIAFDIHLGRGPERGAATQTAAAGLVASRRPPIAARYAR